MSKVQASEPSYELHSLGWKAFQKLSATIIGEIFDQTIQVFFDSHDGGRDGAFNGNWQDKEGMTYSGSFTIQCKFTAKHNHQIKIADLDDEFVKAKRLAAKGLADNYFLFTNASLTGTSDETIRKAFEEIPGITRCLTFGYESVVRLIHENKRLRMLIPRIYGLGDLGQILDDRGYLQASEILSSLGGDLDKFIITDAYRKSAEAIIEHGFVLLLGEPMCGKSTIAASLALGALDSWECSTIKVRNADDFVTHYNPLEKQLFWVDDAFGATQIDWTAASEWNRAFPHMVAALKKGSKAIFTSRSYIYESARRMLKESSLPVIKESQVVIRVENLTKDEKEQILYNHIRLGNQPREFKTKIKPFLSQIASHEKFSPEIARRLGTQFFTKSLQINEKSIEKFVNNPLEMLCEIINTLDDGSRSALALVFLRGGSLASPLVVEDSERTAIEKIGGTVGDATKSLNHLDGSLLIESRSSGVSSWQFKHPTVRDAFAFIVANDQNLLDIYVAGASIEKMFSEVSCGDVNLRGTSVIVPKNLYTTILKKIEGFDTSKWYNKMRLFDFLAYRCDKVFLSEYLKNFPKVISSISLDRYISGNYELNLIIKLYEIELLPEEERSRFVSQMKALAVSIPDAGYLQKDVRKIFLDHELKSVSEDIKTSLVPNLDEVISTWLGKYNDENDPRTYFEDLELSLESYREIFEDDNQTYGAISTSLTRIAHIVSELETDYQSKEKNVFSDNDEEHLNRSIGTRSIFDDVDE